MFFMTFSFHIKLKRQNHCMLLIFFINVTMLQQEQLKTKFILTQFQWLDYIFAGSWNREHISW